MGHAAPAGLGVDAPAATMIMLGGLPACCDRFEPHAAAVLARAVAADHDPLGEHRKRGAAAPARSRPPSSRRHWRPRARRTRGAPSSARSAARGRPGPRRGSPARSHRAGLSDAHLVSCRRAQKLGARRRPRGTSRTSDRAGTAGASRVVAHRSTSTAAAENGGFADGLRHPGARSGTGACSRIGGKMAAPSDAEKNPGRLLRPRRDRRQLPDRGRQLDQQRRGRRRVDLRVCWQHRPPGVAPELQPVVPDAGRSVGRTCLRRPA